MRNAKRYIILTIYYANCYINITILKIILHIMPVATLAGTKGQFYFPDCQATLTFLTIHGFNSPVNSEFSIKYFGVSFSDILIPRNLPACLLSTPMNMQKLVRSLPPSPARIRRFIASRVTFKVNARCGGLRLDFHQ
jgi:hypothetical protein